MADRAQLNRLTEDSSGLFQHPDVPFVHYAQTFTSEPSGNQLLDAYTSLYNAAQASVKRFITANPGRLAFHSADHGDSSISYNLAITTNGMVILPRRSEGAVLRDEHGNDVGFAALNGTALGGTMMVKHLSEWELLRSGTGHLDYVLSEIGLPRGSEGLKSHV